MDEISDRRPRRQARLLAALPLALSAAAWGCSGSVDDTLAPLPGSAATPPAATGTTDGLAAPRETLESAPPPEAVPPADCNLDAGRFVGPSLLRRLTIEQYNRSVAAIFGDDSAPANDFPAATREAGYDNQSSAQHVQRDHVERWERAASSVAQRAAADADTVLQCAGAELDACVPAALPQLGQRLFRRPLSAEESQRYLDFYQQHRQSDSAERALELSLTAMLLSPEFLFVVERGTPLGNGLVQLNNYELASRLSLMLWNQVPDDALLAAAAAGEFDSPQGIAERARAMLQDERSSNIVLDFHSQWIELTEAGDLQLPEGVPSETRQAAQTEIEWFIRDWYQNGSAKIRDLFLSPRAWVDENLADLYGVPAPAQAGPVELPTEQRAGLLTRLVFLGTHTIPPTRGDFILDRILCSPVPPLAIMPPDPPEVSEDATTRERFEVHAKDPCAAACHGLIDPVGFVFEHHDQHGVWRDEEKGKPIDASTDIKIGMSELNGPVDGALELSTRIADSRMASDCLANNWFQYSYGRAPAEQDRCSVELLQERLVAAEGDVRELLVALTQTDAFRFARKEGL